MIQNIRFGWIMEMPGFVGQTSITYQIKFFSTGFLALPVRNIYVDAIIGSENNGLRLFATKPLI